MIKRADYDTDATIPPELLEALKEHDRKAGGEMINEPKTAVEYAALGLSISLPVQQNEVKQTVEKLLVILENIRKAQASTQALLGIVRDVCDHPQKVQVSHTGHLFMQCTTCGKEW